MLEQLPKVTKVVAGFRSVVLSTPSSRPKRSRGDFQKGTKLRQEVNPIYLWTDLAADLRSRLRLAIPSAIPSAARSHRA